MLNTNLYRTVLILLSATRIIFSIPVPDDHSDELIYTPTIANFSPVLEDRPDESSSTFKISYASTEVEGHSDEIILTEHTNVRALNHSDEMISTSEMTQTSPAPEDHSELISLSTFFNTSPAPEYFTTESQNVQACETGPWKECEAFFGKNSKDTTVYKQLEILKDVFRRHSIRTLSPPEEATIRGYVEFIQVLLCNGVQVNKKYGSMKQTLLHHAAEHGHDDLVALLLAQGADVQVKDSVGNTPLIMAVGNYHPTTVKLLLDAGADVNVANDIKQTPLFLAAAYLSSPEYSHTDELLDYQVELINKTYVNGKKIIKLLLEHGADANAVSHFDETPLHNAAKHSDLAIVKLLVDGGANINVKDCYNRTPLRTATESNNVPVVEYLIKKGCDKKIMDINKITALDIAEQRNFTDIVDILSTEMQ